MRRQGGGGGRPHGAGKAIAASAGRLAPRAISNSFEQLFSVQFQHGYYNTAGGECPDFKVVPTPACASLMASLGMIFRDQGTGFSVLIRTSAIGAMISYVGSRYAGAPPGQGCWTWLSFLLIPTNPGFIGITSLPITTNPMAQNLHVSNLQTATVNGAVMLGDGTGLGQKALYPVSGASLTVPTPAGCTAVLADLSGAAVFVVTTSSATATNFGLGDLPYGFYSISFVDGAGGAVPPPTGYSFPLEILHVPDRPPLSLCVLDLLLTQPVAGMGNPAAFPIPPLPAPPISGTPASASTLQPVSLVVPFRPRDTYWRYYVVSQGRRGAFTQDLQITGSGATFQKSSADLPNGDQAVLFSAGTALPLQQRSPYRFKLSGQRQGANGSRDSISVDRLPTAPSSPVWPALSGDALAGSSEIYVYV